MVNCIRTWSVLPTLLLLGATNFADAQCPNMSSGGISANRMRRGIRAPILAAQTRGRGAGNTSIPIGSTRTLAQMPMSHWFGAQPATSPYLVPLPIVHGPKVLPGPPTKYRQPQTVSDAKIIRRFDSNADGKISAAELPSAVGNQLGIVDIDGDGFFDAGEIPEMTIPAPADSFGLTPFNNDLHQSLIPRTDAANDLLKVKVPRYPTAPQNHQKLKMGDSVGIRK